MQTVPSAEFQRNFDRYQKLALSEPLEITDKKQNYIFVSSETYYNQSLHNRLESASLSEIMDEMSRQAKANGLTDKILEELLADES